MNRPLTPLFSLLLLFGLFLSSSASREGERQNVLQFSTDTVFTANVGTNLYDVYACDLSQVELAFYWQDTAYRIMKSIDTLLARTAEKETLLATNAGMYMPDRSPQGLYIEDCMLLSPLDNATKGYGNFYLQPNGVFFIGLDEKAYVWDTPRYAKKADSVKYATQSGPMLLRDGRVHPVFTEGSKNVYVRSGVGVLDEGRRLVFAISQEPTNFYDFAALFLSLGCKDALYLDGAISRAYIPALGRMQTGGAFGAMIAVHKKEKR